MLTVPTIRDVNGTWELSAATAADRQRLERLWQLYRHDLSEFRDCHPDVLAAHPGAWRIGFQNGNPKAARFRRRLAADVGAGVQETLEPVPGKPHIPHDVFLAFTVGA